MPLLCHQPEKGSRNPYVNYRVGSAKRPRNSRLPDRVSRMQKANGWSARKTGGGAGGLMGMALAATPTTVAAAASVPSSFTSTHALWNTAEIKRFRVPSMPEKSACGPKASDMPILANVSFSLKPDSILNRGRDSSTFWLDRK